MTWRYPRDWHRGRTLLLVSWLIATASYFFLFLGATYTGAGMSPRRLLLGLLLTQAVLLAAALLSFNGSFSLIAWARQRPRQVFRAALATQAVLLFAVALTMPEWNDERFNLEQARYLATHGLHQWVADYARINGWLGLHHPPLLPLLYGAFYRLVGANLLAGRLFNIAFALGATLVARRLIARVADDVTAALAAWGWALFPLWWFNGAAAILEGPFLLVFLLAADAFVAFRQNPSARRAAATGAWLTVGMLSRYNVALLAPGMALLLLDREHRALLRRPGTWWIAGVPLLALAPALGFAASSGVLATQAARLSWMALLARPGGPHYLLEVLLPIWPLHVGAQLIPMALLALGTLAVGARRNTTLLALGGSYLLLVLLILPNPRYLLPAVPFLGAGAAGVLQYLDDEGHGGTAVWFGLTAAALVLVAVTITAAHYDGFYTFY